MAMEGSEKWGAVFDWDGVIVDSSRLHEEAWEALAAEERRPLPPGFFLRSFGMKNEQVIEQLLGWTADPKELERLSLRKEELFRALVRERGARLLPGARQLLEALAAAGIPRAVGSSTPRKNIEA
ncbi:MAG: HAD hydrolase-like protein, partial [Verrucomicrobia bacterium]|nr:HAD hydrolase-like protein [Verrucomicrobiota bacterium]